MAGNRQSSRGLPKGAPQRGHGGTLSVPFILTELPVSRAYERYDLEGSGQITNVTPLPRGYHFEILVKSGTPTFTNSTKMLCPGGLDYTAQVGDLIVLRSDGNGVWRLFVQAASGSFGAVRGYIAGLNLSTAGGSATISVGTGVAADSTNVNMLKLSAGVSKTTGTWTLGSGNGGLDTGTVAINTSYHIFLIKRPDTGVVDILISLSATSPTLPTSYTLFRRIGSRMTDGTVGAVKWLGFIQDGDRVMLAAPVTSGLITNPGTSAVTRALGGIPSGVRVRAITAVFGDQASGGNAPGGVLLSDLSLPDVGPSASVFSIFLYASAAATEYVHGSTAEVLTDTSAQIRTRIQISDANTSIRINTMGWVDSRGKDD